MNKSCLAIWGSLLMALAVIFGAFGAHVLKGVLSNQSIEVYKTANFYHFIHSIAIFIVISLNKNFNVKLLWSYFFICGITFFSGSLYILSWTGLNWLGAITPIGGLLFTCGWLGLAINIYKNTKAIDD